MKTLKLLIFTLSTLPLVAYSTPEPKEKIETQNIVNTKNKVYQLTEYKEAINIFKNKNYVKSFQLFGKLLNEYPNDKQINFYYARSAFELKNYEYAFSSFDLILINNPNDSRVRAEFASLYDFIIISVLANSALTRLSLGLLIRIRSNELNAYS